MKNSSKLFVILCAVFLVAQNGNTQTPKINEIYSRGTTTDPDWIEIYNPSTSEFDISGYKIYDSGGQSGSKPKKLFPNGTILAPNGFYIIVTDNTGDPSDFGLSNNGETVWLENTLEAVIDSVEFPALGTDTSYARVPDGSNTFEKLSPTTKGTNNSVVPVELISFSAETLENDVVLTWITATETNNNLFEVQRKSDNSTFIVIGQVKGSGTTTEKKTYSYTDSKLQAGNYTYRLKQIDFDGSYTFSNIVDVKNVIIPKENQLNQNYPNPFNPTTSISYQISAANFVTLKLYDILGNQVAELVNKYQDAGNYTILISLNSFQLSSGTYFCELRTNDFVSVKKMVLLK